MKTESEKKWSYNHLNRSTSWAAWIEIGYYYTVVSWAVFIVWFCICNYHLNGDIKACWNSISILIAFSIKSANAFHHSIWKKREKNKNNVKNNNNTHSALGSYCAETTQQLICVSLLSINVIFLFPVVLIDTILLLWLFH